MHTGSPQSTARKRERRNYSVKVERSAPVMIWMSTVTEGSSISTALIPMIRSISASVTGTRSAAPLYTVRRVCRRPSSGGVTPLGAVASRPACMSRAARAPASPGRPVPFSTQMRAASRSTDCSSISSGVGSAAKVERIASRIFSTSGTMM